MNTTSWNSSPVANGLPPNIRLDATGRLADELPCRACGYNLRSADPNGTCPECGRSVGWSIVGDFLRYSQPEWVEALARGAKLIIVGIIIIVVNMLFSMTGALAIEILLNVLLAVFMIGGIWLLTMPDPSKTEDTPINARTLARYGWTIGYGFQLLSLGLYMLDPQLIASREVANLITSVGIGVTIITLVGQVAVLVHLRRLALRIPDDGLAGQTRIVMWGFIIAHATMIFGILMAIALATAGGAIAIAPACAGGVALLVFSIWAIILIARYRAGFKWASQQARSTWAVQRGT